MSRSGRSGTRDASDIARTIGRRTSIVSDYDPYGQEDRRGWHPLSAWGDSPLDWRPASYLPSLLPARFVIGGRKASRPGRPFALPKLSPVVAFDQPRRVLVCVRRKARREVLFARGTFGRGGQGRRSAYSGISCR